MFESSIAAVICAAGASRRMGGVKKEFLPLKESGSALTVLGAAVFAFASVPSIKTIVIAIPENGEQAARQALPPELLSKKRPAIRFVPGGKTRCASVYRSLSLLAVDNPRYVLIHDGARPWITPAFIEKVIEAVKLNNAVIPILPLTETPKEYVGPFGFSPVFIVRHLKRESTGVAQTPQAFAFPEILEAYEKAAEHEYWENVVFTDDAEVWGRFHGPVAAIPGLEQNRKITFPSDLQ